MHPTPAPDLAGRLRLLRETELVVEGRLVDASNATFFCLLGESAEEATAARACVYKPVRGERPLWDFPDGRLADREYATYLMSEATGWGLIPPTTLRDGPFGPGMVQWWVEDGTSDTLVQVGQDADGSLRLSHADHPTLRRIAVFDVVVNNADRKGSHLLLDPSGQVHAIDHGLCLHAQPKLRTVLWGWAGQPLSAEEQGVLQVLQRALAGELGAELAELLTQVEVSAITERTAALLAAGTLPVPEGDWPSLPWPPV